MAIKGFTGDEVLPVAAFFGFLKTIWAEFRMI